MKKIWLQIADKSRAYFLGHCVSGPGFSILETVVDGVECTFPEKDEIVPLDVAWVQRAMEGEARGTGLKKSAV